MEWYYLLCIPAYKLLNNSILYWRMKSLHYKYWCWLASNEGFADLAKSRSSFKSLMKKADIDDCIVPKTIPTGYMSVAHVNYPVLEQFPSREESFVVATNTKMLEAMGVFKSRCIETVNPIYWINTVIFLPKKVISYLGVSAESILIKLAQLIWWIVCLIITIINFIYPDYLRNILQVLFPTIFHVQ